MGTRSHKSKTVAPSPLRTRPLLIRRNSSLRLRQALDPSPLGPSRKKNHGLCDENLLALSVVVDVEQQPNRSMRPRPFRRSPRRGRAHVVLGPPAR